MWGFIVFLILFSLFVIALPSWPYSRRWGYAPAGAVAGLLLLFLFLVWLGMIAVSWPWYY